MHKAERGLFELRRGRMLFVAGQTPAAEGTGASVLLASVERLDEDTLEALRRLGKGPARLAVTHHRAQAMGFARARANGHRPPDLSLALSDDATPAEILRLASAVVVEPPTGDVRDASEAESGGLALARHGRLLPALVGVSVDAEPGAELRAALASGGILEVTPAEIQAMTARPGVDVTFVSDAIVPLEDAEDARFMFFAETVGLLEHVAILIGDPETWPDPVPVRLHSACLTGDLFGSLRCDCGEQLRGSLRVFTERGGGVLLYLAQEGRGIGLGNKFRAYALQQEGLDTMDADCALGFGPDERRYDVAVEILRRLGIERVELLTNNPDKVRALEEAGIRVVERRALHGTLNPHNLRYVKAKVQRAGHWLSEMLSEAISGD